MSAGEFVVTIPGTPGRDCSPNTPTHHMAKYRAKAEYKRTAQMACLNPRYDMVGIGGGPIFTEPVSLHAVIGWEWRRQRMDTDNAIAILKSAIDGIAEAGIVENDKLVKEITVEQTRDPDKVGYVEVTIRAIGGGR